MRQACNLNKVCNEPNDRTLSLSLSLLSKKVDTSVFVWSGVKSEQSTYDIGDNTIIWMDNDSCSVRESESQKKIEMTIRSYMYGIGSVQLPTVPTLRQISYIGIGIGRVP